MEQLLPRDESEKEILSTPSAGNMDEAGATVQPVPAEGALPSKKAKDKAKDEEWFRLRSGIGLTAIVLIFWAGTLYVWLLAHGVPMEGFLFPTPNFIVMVSRFNFLGTTPAQPNPSILSLNFEIIMWSIFGVVIRTVYEINLAIRHGRFVFFSSLVKFIGDLMIGGGLSEIVILFLSIAHLSIGSADLTLAEANYGTVAAVAFILGFYNEDAPKVLSRFRNTIIETGRRSDEAKEKPPT